MLFRHTIQPDADQSVAIDVPRADFRLTFFTEISIINVDLASGQVPEGTLPGTGRGELMDRALDPVALTIARRRGHRIGIGRLRFQTSHAHAENRLGMTAVEPDWRLRHLGQLPGIGPVVHYAEMLIVPAGVAGRPLDNGQIIDGHFEGRLLRDLGVRSLRRRRKDLSEVWGGAEHATNRRGDRGLENLNSSWNRSHSVSGAGRCGGWLGPPPVGPSAASRALFCPTG